MRMLNRYTAALAVLLLLSVQPNRVSAQYGSTYLGCFSFSRMLYLKGVEGVKATQHTKATIGSCFKDCRQRGYSLSIVATDFRCWCAMQTPPPLALTDDSACQQGSNKGALVFYHYEGSQACRVQELHTDPSNFITGPDSKAAVMFDSVAQAVAMNTNSGPQRIVAKWPAQLYGQFEVSAKVSVHPAVVTSIDIQEAATSGAQAKAPSSDDISLQFYNTTAAGVGKNILLGTASRSKAAVSALDHLLKPAQYKTLGALKHEENLGTAWVTYTIDWQSDRVTWAMNGVPLMTQWRTNTAKTESGKLGQVAAGGRRGLLASYDLNKLDQQRRQQQRKQSKSAAQQQQQQQPWAPPDKPAQLSFSVRWNPKAEATQQQQQPVQSSFMETRRIVCDKPRVRGDKGPVVPTWFILGADWQIQGTSRQAQPTQQQKQQMKAQANKKDNAANSAAASGVGKSDGSTGGQAKQQQAKQQQKGKQQQHMQPDAYAREQHSHVSSKPNAGVEGKKRRDRSAETEAEAHKQQHQQQRRQQQQQQQQRPHQNQEEEEEWPQESLYAGLFGHQDRDKVTQRWLARLAAQQDMVQPDAGRSSDDEDVSVLGFSEQDRAGYMGYRGHVRVQPEGPWRLYADDAEEGAADRAVQLQGMSWGEDEPDWDDDNDSDFDFEDD